METSAGRGAAFDATVETGSPITDDEARLREHAFLVEQVARLTRKVEKSTAEDRAAAAEALAVAVAALAAFKEVHDGLDQ